MKKGRFIVIEGADGTGKSTHAKLLGNYLKEKGHEVVNTAEPTQGFIGQAIRMVLSGKIEVSPTTLTLLFTADRAEHVEKVIKPALDEGKVVICERYFYSTIAYQSVQGINPQWISQVNSFAPEPDLVVLLEVNPEDALSRMNRDKEVFEVLDFQKQVQQRLLDFAYKRGTLAKPGRAWKVVSTSEEQEKVQERIREVVETHLVGK
jgi:dTMP kinase